LANLPPPDERIRSLSPAIAFLLLDLMPLASLPTLILGRAGIIQSRRLRVFDLNHAFRRGRGGIALLAGPNDHLIGAYYQATGRISSNNSAAFFHNADAERMPKKTTTLRLRI
jgi:hypothetical protein